MKPYGVYAQLLKTLCLTAEVQVARAQIIRAATVEEKRNASAALQYALERFTDFAARNIMPEEYLPPANGSVDK
jgi:hypothetical protein